MAYIKNNIKYIQAKFIQINKKVNKNFDLKSIE